LGPFRSRWAIFGDGWGEPVAQLAAQLVAVTDVEPFSPAGRVNERRQLVVLEQVERGRESTTGCRTARFGPDALGSGPTMLKPLLLLTLFRLRWFVEFSDAIDDAWDPHDPFLAG
jgi:hypothetical protein